MWIVRVKTQQTAVLPPPISTSRQSAAYASNLCDGREVKVTVSILLRDLLVNLHPHRMRTKWINTPEQLNQNFVTEMKEIINVLY